MPGVWSSTDTACHAVTDEENCDRPCLRLPDRRVASAPCIHAQGPEVLARCIAGVASEAALYELAISETRPSALLAKRSNDRLRARCDEALKESLAKGEPKALINAREALCTPAAPGDWTVAQPIAPADFLQPLMHRCGAPPDRSMTNDILRELGKTPEYQRALARVGADEKVAMAPWLEKKSARPRQRVAPRRRARRGCSRNDGRSSESEREKKAARGGLKVHAGEETPPAEEEEDGFYAAGAYSPICSRRLPSLVSVQKVAPFGLTVRRTRPAASARFSVSRWPR